MSYAIAHELKGRPLRSTTCASLEASIAQARKSCTRRFATDVDCRNKPVNLMLNDALRNLPSGLCRAVAHLACMYVAHRCAEIGLHLGHQAEGVGATGRRGPFGSATQSLPTQRCIACARGLLFLNRRRTGGARIMLRSWISANAIVSGESSSWGKRIPTPRHSKTKATSP